METIFSHGEPLWNVRSVKKGNTTYEAVSVEPNIVYARRSAQDWRNSGYKSFFKKVKGMWVVYIQVF